MENPNLELGSFLRSVRKGLKKTISQMADEHISTATISNLETGRKFVSPEKIDYYCQKLNVNPNEIPNNLIKAQQQKKRTSQKLNCSYDPLTMILCVYLLNRP